MCLSRTHSTSRWATRCVGPGPRVATVSPAVLLARADSQYCSPDDMNCVARNSFQRGHCLQHTFTSLAAYSYHCVVHCVIGMRGVINVSGGCTPSGWSAGPDMPTVWSERLAFISKPTATFTPWAAAFRMRWGDDFQHVLQYNPSYQQLDSDGIDIAR